MEMLFHSFPRPSRAEITAPGKAIPHETYAKRVEQGFRILELILKHGMLCTPERFELFADSDSENLEKLQCYQHGVPYDTIMQSRACFTLLERAELTRRLPYESEYEEQPHMLSHIDMFGPITIGLSPIEARSFGIIPTIYYYGTRHDTFPNKAEPHPFVWHIINRLDELRIVSAILGHVESIYHANHKPASGKRGQFPNRLMLEEMGVALKYERQAAKDLDLLSADVARDIYHLFDIDRVPAWNLHDCLSMLLSLYQTADSTLKKDPLAFFRQREWRLIHHMQSNHKWFCLGNRQQYVDYFSREFSSARKEMLDYLRSIFTTLDKDRIKHFWILNSVDGRHFREFITEIIVPRAYISRARRLVSRFTFESRRPQIKAYGQSWSLDLETLKLKVY
jgi:hypothetical protein